MRTYDDDYDYNGGVAVYLDGTGTIRPYQWYRGENGNIAFNQATIPPEIQRALIAHIEIKLAGRKLRDAGSTMPTVFYSEGADS